MIEVLKERCYYRDGAILTEREGRQAGCAPYEEARQGTMAYRILKAHNTSPDMDSLRIKFDAMASHDITYVGILQTARASGLKEFPIPYVLTNCHNSLCAVGGTINEDDHVFGLSAAKKYGGEFVPAHQAVIHSYMRERYAAPGKMIIGSDSHTRYGAFGTLAVGEGGPELAKQLLHRTYDIPYPPVMAVCLTGRPNPGVGPQDVALAIIARTFPKGLLTNVVMEFVGPGIQSLSIDYRSGIDCMTTEAACLSSVWETDGVVRQALESFGRGEEYREQHPANGACYDGAVTVDLSQIRPMIALPFHPSLAYPIAEFKANMKDLLHEVDQRTAESFSLKTAPTSLTEKIHDGKFYVDQAVIAGCSGGTYQNLRRAAEILQGKPIGSDHFWLSCYPGSMPIFSALSRDGILPTLMASGASIRSCFCGPCFGAGDVPANGAFSIRHSTRNFPNREGSKPGDGQISYVALMDARSIAATALNGGALTAADELPNPPVDSPEETYFYDDSAYKARVYCGVGHPQPETELIYGPNITDWPPQIAMPENLLIQVASAIYDPVTTTDELIPSGDTSSYRSNPLRLAEFTLSRKDPAYVGRAKEIQAREMLRRADPEDSRLTAVAEGYDLHNTGIGSAVMALKPGDGSAREQAASCQRVLGGVANLVEEFATKRYRSNVVNWGMLPFVVPNLRDLRLKAGDVLYVPGIRALLEGDGTELTGYLLRGGNRQPVTLTLPGLTREERDIILSGCLMNYYAV